MSSSELIQQKRVEKTKEGTQLLCQRCNYNWNYKGVNPYVCSCPFCHTSVTVYKKRNLEKENDSN